MLNDYFDKIYVINLKRREDRLLKFDRLSKKYNFYYEIFEALDKKNIDNDFTYNNIKITEPYGDYYYFSGQVGCLISHLEILKKCKAENVAKALIFEDDVNFCEGFENKLRDFMNSINQNWQFLYLSGSLPKFIRHYHLYSKVSSILTTHSYSLKREIYDDVIKHLEKNIFKKPVDLCYTDLQSTFNTYVAMPFLTYQEGGFSDIGDGFRDYNSITKYL